MSAQSKYELEARRKKTLEEISYVDNLLKTTAKEKIESMSAVNMIGKKLALRETVISGMREEISLINERIDLNTLAVEMMEDDLMRLKSDYARSVVNSYRSGKSNPELIYILSAKDFNQGYKRIKYLQQLTKFRRNESELIIELKGQIESSKKKLQEDLFRVSDLKTKEEQQKELLQEERGKKQRMVKTLGSKEQQLKKDLAEKKRIAKKIETEISRIVEEERKKAVVTPQTPALKVIGDNFAENKGSLPWPVERGIITAHFGVQKHAILKYVMEENDGIEITGSGKTLVRSVFRGEVSSIFPIRGANMTVIIRHGKFLSVYSNIVNIKVKTGDKVETMQPIGEVYSDPADNNNYVLKFMIFESKYQDPEEWISKK
jgi:septal ring factor EnvC (AmiA/AmiB activator)